MGRRESFSRREHEIGEIGRKEGRKNRRLLRRALGSAPSGTQDLNPPDSIAKPTVIPSEQPTTPISSFIFDD